jgi:hypothetical protein
MTLNSGSRIKLLAVGTLAFVIASGTVVTDVRDYRRAGTVPSDTTLTEAREVSRAHPFVRRWVRLTEPLELDCGQALQETEDGKLKAIVVLAFDGSKTQPFLLDYERDQPNCEELKALPLEGILDEPLTKFWTVHGMTLPSTSNPVITLRVGAHPSGLKTEAELLTAVALISLWLLWFAYKSGPSKPFISPEKAFAQNAAQKNS